MIELKELEKALLKCNYKIPSSEVLQIIQEIDYDGNDQINYSEFLAATISVKKILTHEKLEALFLQFDLDKKNEISASNIIVALRNMGREISLEELQEIMRKHDKSNDGAIQFEEFRQMLLNESAVENELLASPIVKGKSTVEFPAGS